MHMNVAETDGAWCGRKCNNSTVSAIRQTNYDRCNHLDTTASALCEKIDERYVSMVEIAVHIRYDSFDMIHA